MQDAILLISSNLFFFPRIKAAANKCNLSTKMITNPVDLDNAKKNHNVQFILIDLEFEIWDDILNSIKSKDIPYKSIIAFGPHSDTDSFEKAKNLGCTSVLPKGTFSNKLNDLFNESSLNV
ncbi:MAG: hypothetical protein FI687_01050 [SAR202 cluster bacterium]|nr:hypothetical protein [SAR202 cluster bacterium]|tara:strand:- start:30624 stop:30986 length:363 start_codon:yes stop_codon:yes gene_type:complete